jgi:hypothetical protein
MNASNAINMAGKNIVDLKLLVLRIAKLHLTAAVGACSLAGKSSLSKKIDKNKPVQKSILEEEDIADENVGGDWKRKHGTDEQPDPQDGM